MANVAVYITEIGAAVESLHERLTPYGVPGEV